ncbi:MAG: histidinol dehydrogenase [Candidatus Promineifilaceae bacterium]
MFRIYTVDEAQKTILCRPLLGQSENYPPDLIASLERLFGEGAAPPTAVSQILQSVRDEGDAALRRWSRLLDNAELETFTVSKEALASAENDLSPTLIAALQTAADRIRHFHARQPLPNWQTTEMGGILGQRVTPIRRVGIYVPGGRAPLPSSLLMSAVPAQVAGVEEIVICTPPNPHPAILAAAHLCGLETVFQIGGAQAIAAMAFGTATVPRVDKIVGAGNLFVTLAKQQVYGLVGLDGLAGPTETMVIADETADPAWIAADLLAQAEHDPLAAAILLTPFRHLAEAVQLEIGRQLEALSRAEIIAQSLTNNGGAVITADMETAVQLANSYAPEHLCLSVANPLTLAPQIANAGGLFLGEYSFEVLGDYVAGPSHIMPTGGTARFASPLNVLDFVKINSIIALDPATGQQLSPIATQIALTETLTAHAAAAQKRTK